MKRKFGYLNNTEKKVVQSFVKELREKLGNYIVTIQLFGSKVRGDDQGLVIGIADGANSHVATHFGNVVFKF